MKLLKEWVIPSLGIVMVSAVATFLILWCVYGGLLMLAILFTK